MRSNYSANHKKVDTLNGCDNAGLCVVGLSEFGTLGKSFRPGTLGASLLGGGDDITTRTVVVGENIASGCRIVKTHGAGGDIANGTD